MLPAHHSIAVTNMGTLNVTTGSVTTADAPGPVYMEIEFDADGSIDKDSDGAIGSYNDATDWIIPHGKAASKTYYVKATEQTSTGGGTKTGTMTTWIDISTSPTWRITRSSGAGSGTSSWGILFEISTDQSTTLVSGTITLNAQIL